MSYKIKEIIDKMKKMLPVYIVLWVFLVVVLIIPFSCACKNATMAGGFDFEEFFESCGNATSNLGETIKQGFSKEYIGSSLKGIGYFSIVYIVVLVIGTIKNAGKTEYRDIEHGSSDWSKGGEQYKVLSNKKGIILAENNYLPLDKRGNVNVLIVGRFRFW